MFRYLSVLAVLLCGSCLADEAEAIAALKTSGVGFKSESDGSWRVYIHDDIKPERLKRILEVANITNVTVLLYADNADHLAILKKIPTIRKMELTGRMIDDTDLKHASDISSLTELFVSSENVTDAGLLRLAKIKGLKKVTISGKQITKDAREKLNDLLPGCVVK